MPTRTAELMRDTYEAFGRRDVEAVMARFDGHTVRKVPRVLRLASTWDEFGVEIQEMSKSGDRVSALGRATGRIGGAPASYAFLHVWTLRDGVCVRLDEFVERQPELLAA
jgi:ketosteroid isomerase-like protein